MADLVMVLVLVVFIALCVVYVWWCDRIIGPDPVPTAPCDDEAVGTPVEVAA